MFQFLKTFRVPKLDWKGGKSSMRFFAGKQEFWIYRCSVASHNQKPFTAEDAEEAKAKSQEPRAKG
ncbi:MAG: hypothetical protein DMG65_18785 [Candidatus Angelobacter sp. Gp1-AA117]|nr:MAG: hypothetical protein DMG65_18785 [Candidatus Angelobacter sp. Gp1-AA117]